MLIKLLLLSTSIFGLFSILFLNFRRVNSSKTEPAVLYGRFKRQVLPVEHLKIHSIRSNITVNNENIEAISSESIIALEKQPYNATVFSRHSTTNFDSNGTFVRINAQAIDFALLFQRMVFRSMANLGDLEMRIDNKATNQSMLRLRLAENVQFGLTDEQSLLRILSSNATQISLTAATQQQILPRQLQLGYDNASDVFKIQFTEGQSRVSVDISRSILHLNYGNIFLQMDNNYRRLVILTSGHRLEFHTLGSLFQLQFDEQGMSIVYPHDSVRVHASNSSRNVTVNVDTISKMDIKHTEDSRVSLRGSNFTNGSIHNLEVISARMALNLYADNDSLILATTNQSKITLNSTAAEFLLASTSHQIEVIGNKPFLMATTENVALVITSISGQQIQVPLITVPDVDYNRYNLQNLTQLDNIGPGTAWLTSKINVDDLIGEEIAPIRNFSSIIGVQQANVTIPPIIINPATPGPIFISTLFPEISTLSPLVSNITIATQIPTILGQATLQPPINIPGQVTLQPPTNSPEIPNLTNSPDVGVQTFPTNSPEIPNLTNNPDVGVQTFPTNSPDIGMPTLPTNSPEIGIQTFPTNSPEIPATLPNIGPDVTTLNAQTLPPINPEIVTQPNIIPELTTLTPTLVPDIQTIAPLNPIDSTVNPALTNIPETFPTPIPLETTIAETGFPLPPINVDSSRDGPQTVLTTASTDDTFVIGQFETQPPNSFPLEATIVNVSLSGTTQMPS